MIYKYSDTKDEIRYGHVKCTGEVPSCERCLRRGKQCGGYHTAKNNMRQGQVAATRDNILNHSASATLQSLEQDSTKRQVPTPRNDAWDLPVDQNLQQNNTANCSTLTNDLRNYPVDFPVQYHVQPRAPSRQLNKLQGDEARSRGRKAFQEHERMMGILRENRDNKQ